MRKLRLGDTSHQNYQSEVTFCFVKYASVQCELNMCLGEQYQEANSQLNNFGRVGQGPRGNHWWAAAEKNTPKDRTAGVQLVTRHKLQLVAICCEVVILGVVDCDITLQ